MIEKHQHMQRMIPKNALQRKPGESPCPLPPNKNVSFSAFIQRTPRATHCTDRAQSSTATVCCVRVTFLCQPLLAFARAVRVRREIEKATKKITDTHIYILYAYWHTDIINNNALLWEEGYQVRYHCGRECNDRVIFTLCHTVQTVIVLYEGCNRMPRWIFANRCRV